MKEHDFVRTKRGIYRIFGSRHPVRGPLLLLRYFRTRTGWTKPPVHAVESLSSPFHRHYDIETIEVLDQGMRLGIGSFDPENYQQHYDALDESRTPELARIRSVAGVPVGLGGSRLVGLATARSDLDLTLYGADGPPAGRELIATFAGEGMGLPHSSALSSLWATGHHDEKSLARRNIYKAITRLAGTPVKVDIHYASADTPCQPGGLTGASIAETERTTLLEIVDASHRHLFPDGWLVGRTRDRMLVTVSILDHALAYCLEGDRIRILVRDLAREDPASGPQCVGLRLLELLPAGARA